MAERDLRMIDLLIYSQSAEGIKQCTTSLQKQYGRPVIYELTEMTQRKPEKVDRDRAGLMGLKGMGRVT